MRRFLSSSIAEVNSPSYQASSTYCVLTFWLYMSGPNSFYLYPTLTHSWMGMKTQLDRYDTTGVEDGVWSHMLIGYTTYVSKFGSLYLINHFLFIKQVNYVVFGII